MLQIKILLMRNSSAKLKSVAYGVKLRMFELRMMSWHWMKMNILSCVIDCLNYGDQTTAQESAEIGEEEEEEEDWRVRRRRSRSI